MMGKKDRSKKKDKKRQEAEQPAEGENAATEGADTPTPEESPLEQAERERDELRALWQRSQADYQNLKRRQLADTDQAVRTARANLMTELLVVLDYLDMALMGEVQSDEARNLRVGVEMTRQQFWNSLEQQGVSLIPTTGAFDADLHQAVATMETDEHEAGTILEVTRKGYRLPEFVLRHAQVKVATAPGAPAPEEATGDEAEGEEAASEASAESATEDTTADA